MEKLIAEPEELAIINSPAKIDLVVQLATMKQWFIIGAISLLFFILIGWSFISRIPVQVSGKGVLIQEQGISEIKLSYPGRISQLNVRIGQHVEQGEVLATVEQLDLSFSIKKNESEIREVNDNLVFLLQNSDPRSRKKTILVLRNEINVKKTELDKSDGDMLNKEENEKAYWRLKLRLIDLQNYSEQRILESRNRLTTLESELRLKNNQLTNQSQIISPYSGNIIDMSVNNGDIFNSGATLIMIENQDYNKNDLIALVYLNANEGKKIKPGMKVYIAPSTAAAEEFGYIVGNVKYVSKYAQTESGMNRVLRNQKLLEELSRDGLPMLVEVKLLTDTSTFSKYKWTTGKGPEIEIVSGTLIKGSIITTSKKPISFVLPL